jgi:prepilin-type N-terminal cleavage/methylation domain-containing protein
MKQQNKILGFTLIELLVVITIIGILATGATSVYTSQIQKARDSTRISDIHILRG